MRILCLNCRGCAQPATIHEFRLLIEQHRPEVIFLSETKVDAQRSENLRFKLGFQNAIGVSSDGLSGGLVLMWRNGTIIRRKTLNPSHIDVYISNEGTGVQEWRFTGFYGQPNRNRREESWHLLKFLRSTSTLPWLCAGDFNEVLSEEEYFGARDREEWRMQGFREAVEYCGLFDIGFNGLPYTWDNRQKGERNVKVRLDRGLANAKFMDRFPSTEVTHIQTSESDHCALLIDVATQVQNDRRKIPRVFRYENMWSRDPTYEDLINSNWSCCTKSLEGVRSSLLNMQRSLQSWSYNVFGSVRGNLNKLRKELEEIRKNSWCGGVTNEEKAILNKISELSAREEIMLSQRSRIEWLTEGDRNTSFFHAKCRDRARQNKIVSLKKEDGTVCHQQKELENVAMEYYIRLFSAQAFLSPNEVIQFVPQKVTDNMNQTLCRPFTTEEVERALFMMKPNKSLGPDGFTAGFYQKHWLLLKDDICHAVLDFLGGGDLPPEVLANRLREVPNDIISEEQSAFVPGRLITDNVLMAYECIHYLKRKKSKTGLCAIKLDMMKAYDRVEWDYLRSIMLKLGFADSWVSLIMKCVETVSFSVRVNGHFSQLFNPSRGIRQGDPISPYLFLLCAEGLSCLLKYSGPLFLSKVKLQEGVQID